MTIKTQWYIIDREFYYISTILRLWKLNQSYLNFLNSNNESSGRSSAQRIVDSEWR